MFREREQSPRQLTRSSTVLDESDWKPSSEGASAASWQPRIRPLGRSQTSRDSSSTSPARRHSRRRDWRFLLPGKKYDDVSASKSEHVMSSRHIPRPHLPRNLSLNRVKIASGVQQQSQPGQQPSTPPATHSRNSSPSRGAGSMVAHAPKSPADGRGDHKNMGLVLRIEVLKGRNLAPKDKSGTSDPFLILTLGDAKQATSVVNKTLNPEWNQTFELPIASSDSALLEAVCWDKDRFRNDYMGEFDVGIEDVFGAGNVSPEATWYKLEGRRSGRRKKKDENVSGEILLKFTLYDAVNSAATPTHIMQKLTGLVADPADDEEEDEEELLNRLSSRDLDDVYEDEDDPKQPSDETDDGTRTPMGTQEEEQKKRRRRRLRRLKRKSKLKAYEFSGVSEVAGVLYLEIQKITDLPPEKNMTGTTFDMDPFVVTSLGKKTYRTRVVNHNLNPVYNEKLVFQVQKNEINFSLCFSVVDRDKFSGNDFVGTVNFPLDKVLTFSPAADSDTGLYRLPDPDNVLNGGEPERRKRFRIPMSRSSSANNAGKLSRNNSANNLAKLHKTPSNKDLNALLNARPPLTQQTSELGVSETSRPVIVTTPGGTNNSLASEDSDLPNDDAGMYSFELPLELKNKQRWEDKHSPVLYIRAKFLPYRALRQQFWRALLRQYDADESGKVEKIELITMLDTLGSTLHNKTIDGFFSRWRDTNGTDEFLTMDQAVICLEEQLMKSLHVHQASSSQDPSTTTANLTTLQSSSPDSSPQGGTPHLGSSKLPQNILPGTTSIPVLEVSDLGDEGEQGQHYGSAGEGEIEHEADLNEDPDNKEEHVVEIHECPICHQPRLVRPRKTTDADIITHIATCASNDWRAVNNIVMAGFVTSSQAQRKWYSKVITKVSYGGYRLGANSANILVQDRTTGMINEERMSVYVRLGIRLLYKGLKSREMEKKRTRKLLRSLSFKQGRKYDDPASASQIPGFINFHQLDMSEVLRPTEDFKTFNEFFYRALKPNARPCSAPNNTHIVVSPADSRSVCFNRLDDAQRIWVKGREFSLERLLGEAYPQDAKRYKNGALGIFRLAPQDYHRFHIPVDGVMGEPKLIEGEYYTVNPMAIRSALDVYGENVRILVPIDSVSHGRVMVVCVGAMMVGSTIITREKGENVKRAEELGYFKFGGSTILLLFEPGMMKFDEDLADNSTSAVETLVRVGMSIGRSPSHPPHTPDMRKENPSQEERENARRKIEGSLAPSISAVGSAG